MDTPRGLLVPCVKQVQNLSIFEIAHALNELQELGAAGKLGEEQLTGGTITYVHSENSFAFPPRILFCSVVVVVVVVVVALFPIDRCITTTDILPITPTSSQGVKYGKYWWHLYVTSDHGATDSDCSFGTNSNRASHRRRWFCGFKKDHDSFMGWRPPRNRWREHGAILQPLEVAHRESACYACSSEVTSQHSDDMHRARARHVRERENFSCLFHCAESLGRSDLA